MARQGARTNWFPDRIGLSLLVIISVILAGLIVLTYLQYVLLAIILAYVLMPAQRRLEQHLSSMLAAASLIALSVVVLFLPIAYILTLAVQQGLELLAAFQEGGLSQEFLEERLGSLGYVVDVDLLYATYREPIEAGLQGLASGAISVLGGLPNVLIGLTVTVFVLFALLRDGDRLLSWLEAVVPVSERVQQELLIEFDHLMWASVLGNVAVAGIQAVAIGIGLALIGVPGVVFLTVLTFLFALFPLVGAFGVWLPMSGYLLVVGRPVAAVLLIAYGALVSASDVYLRPLIINRTGAINVAIIVLGIFGGIVVFGAIGLFVGPVVLGGAKVILDVYARERPHSIGY